MLPSRKKSVALSPAVEPTTLKRKRSRRGVRFAQSTSLEQVYEVQRLYEDEEHASELWYTPQEMKAITKRCIKVRDQYQTLEEKS